MKKLAVVCILVIGVFAFGAYGQTKNDDIVKLLQVSKTDKLADQMMDVLIQQVKPMAPAVPNEFWVKFKAKMNINELLQMCIPIYDKHFTHDEIKQLITFYGSPLGQKMVAVTPLLTQETMAAGQKWGEKLGQEIIMELMRDGHLKQ